MRQPWSSVRCQWNEFILCSAIRSMNRITNALGMKCRDASSIAPRHLKRGWSLMRAHGMPTGPVALVPNVAAGISWRRVWHP